MNIKTFLVGAAFVIVVLEAHEVYGQNIQMPDQVHAIGYVEPVSEVRRLVFESDGVLAACNVKEGDSVKAGDVLMKLRDERQQAQATLCAKQLELARAERSKILSGVNEKLIAATEKRVKQAQEQVRYLQREYERVGALSEKKAVSDADKDKAESALNQAREIMKAQEEELGSLVQSVRKEDRALADCKVSIAEANLECSNQEIKKTELCAPIDGVIMRVFKFPGEGVSHLDVSPVIMMADVSRLRVTAEIDERYVSLVKPGMKATVSERGRLEKTSVEGAVARVGNVMGKKSLLSRELTELRDLDVVEVWISLPEGYSTPVGLQMDVVVSINSGK